MRYVKYIIVVQLFLASFMGWAAEKVIYGKDDRKEVYKGTTQEQVLAKSTMSQVEVTNLELKDGKYLVRGESLADGYGICSSERFAKQVSAARCSGFFLWGGNTLITAGHCVENQSDCENYKWIFDFHEKGPMQQGGR